MFKKLKEKVQDTDSIKKRVQDLSASASASIRQSWTHGMKGKDAPTGVLVNLNESTENNGAESSGEMFSIEDDDSVQGEDRKGHQRSSIDGEGIRSRHSSISSLASDNSFLLPQSFAGQTPFTARAPATSDIESTSEVDESLVAGDTVSKGELVQRLQRVQTLARRYKTKFYELMEAYKRLESEREKVRATMTQSQDKSFRRISELREQIQLDKLAKRDIEDNYRLLLEEKDELVQVLRLQVKLLREGKDLPPELEEKIKEKHEREAQQQKTIEQENNQLKETIKKREELLKKCKDRIASLTAEKELMKKALEEQQTTVARGGDSISGEVAVLRSRLSDSECIREALESQVASAKAQIQVLMCEDHVQAVPSSKLVVEANSQGGHFTVEGAPETHCEEHEAQLSQLRDELSQRQEEHERALDEMRSKIRDLEEVLKEKTEAHRPMEEQGYEHMKEPMQQSEDKLDHEAASHQLESEIVDLNTCIAQLETQKEELTHQVAVCHEERETEEARLRAEHDARIAELTAAWEGERVELTRGVESQTSQLFAAHDSHVKEKESQIEYYSDLVTNLKQQLKELSEKMEHHGSEVEGKDGEIEKYRGVSEELQSKLDEVAATRELLEDEVKKLREEVFAKAATIDAMSGEKVSREELVQTNRDLLQRVSTEVEEKEETLTRLQTRERDLKNSKEEYAALKDSANQIQAEYHTCVTRIAELTEELETCKDKLRHSEDFTTQLKQHLGNVTEERDKLEGHHKRLLEETKRLRDEVDLLKDSQVQLASLKEEFLTARKCLDTMTEEIAAKSQEMLEKDERIAHLTGEIEERSSVIASLEEKCRLSEEKCMEIKEDCDRRLDEHGEQHHMEMEALIKSASSEQTDMGKELEEHRIKVMELNRKSQCLEDKITTLNSDLSAKIAEFDCASNELEEKNTTIAQLSNERDNLVNENKVRKDDITRLDAEVDTLTTDKEASVARLAELTEKLNQSIEENTKLQSDNSQLQTNLNELMSQREVVSISLAEKDKEIEELNDQVNAVKEEKECAMQQHEDRFEELNLKINEHLDQLNILKEEKASLDHGTSSLNAELEACRAEKDCLVERLNSAEAKLADIDASLQRVESEKQAIQDELEHSKNDLQIKIAGTEELSQQLDEKDCVIKGLNEEISSVKEERSILQDKHTSLNTHIDTLSSEKANLQAQLTALTEEVGSKGQEGSSLRQEVAASEVKCQNLAASLAEKEQLMSDLRCHIQTLETAKQSIEEELEKSCQRYTADLKDFHTTIDDLSDRERRLQEEVRNITETKVLYETQITELQYKFDATTVSLNALEQDTSLLNASLVEKENLVASHENTLDEIERSHEENLKSIVELYEDVLDQIFLDSSKHARLNSCFKTVMSAQTLMTHVTDSLTGRCPTWKEIVSEKNVRISVLEAEVERYNFSKGEEIESFIKENREIKQSLERSEKKFGNVCKVIAQLIQFDLPNFDEGSIKELLKFLKEKEKTRISVTTKLEEAQEERENLSKQVDSLKEELTQIHSTLELTSSQLSERISEKEQIASELVIAQNFCEELKLSVSCHEITLKEKEDVNEDLNSQVTQLSERCKELADKCSTMEALLQQNASLTEKIEQMSLELESTVTSRNSNEQELKQELDEMSEKLKLSTKEHELLLAELKESIVCLENEKSNLEVNRSQLEKRLMDLEADMEAKEVKKHDEIDSLQKSLDELNHEKRCLEEELERTRREAETRSEEIHMLRSEHQVSTENSQRMEEYMERIRELERRHSEEIFVLRREHDEKMNESENKLSEVKSCLELRESEVAQLQKTSEEKQLLGSSLQDDLNKVAANLRQKEEALGLKTKELENATRKVDELKVEKTELFERIKAFQKERKDFEETHRRELEEIESNHKEELQILQSDYQSSVDAVTEEQNTRVKQVSRDFNLKIKEKESQFQKTFEEALEKTRSEERRLRVGFEDEIRDLRETVSDRDNELQDLEEKIRNLESQIKNLEEKLESSESRLMQVENERQSTQDDLDQARTAQTDLEARLAEMTEMSEQRDRELANQATGEMMKMVSDEVKMEGDARGWLTHFSDKVEQVKQETLQARPTDGSGGSLVDSRDYEILQMHNADLQEQLRQLSSDYVTLKQQPMSSRSDSQEQPAAYSIPTRVTISRSNSGLSNEMPPPSNAGEYGSLAQRLTGRSSHDSHSSLSEATEYEYLKNILYEYMLGKQTKILAKVLCTVMRMTPDQTQSVLEHEDAKAGKIWH